MEDRGCQLMDVAYRNGLFLAVGTTSTNDMLMVSSANGRSWRKVTLD